MFTANGVRADKGKENGRWAAGVACREMEEKGVLREG